VIHDTIIAAVVYKCITNDNYSYSNSNSYSYSHLNSSSSNQQYKKARFNHQNNEMCYHNKSHKKQCQLVLRDVSFSDIITLYIDIDIHHQVDTYLNGENAIQAI
jgi:hypothetical protein